MAVKCYNNKEVTENIDSTSEIREEEQQQSWQKKKNLATFLNYSKEEFAAIESELSGDEYDFVE